MRAGLRSLTVSVCIWLRPPPLSLPDEQGAHPSCSFCWVVKQMKVSSYKPNWLYYREEVWQRSTPCRTKAFCSKEFKVLARWCLHSDLWTPNPASIPCSFLCGNDDVSGKTAQYGYFNILLQVRLFKFTFLLNAKYTISSIHHIVLVLWERIP